MCFFDQTRWVCGYFKWGRFRKQCPQEYRMGETCGLKLVYETYSNAVVCKICQEIGRKARKVDRGNANIMRWKQEGCREATIEATRAEIEDLHAKIRRLQREHMNYCSKLGGSRQRIIREPRRIQPTLADKMSDLFTTGHIKSAGQSSTVSRQPENRLCTFTNPSAKASLDT
ncbi:hypothetical protein EDB80DRAFT_309995 [Ilyonectria destructans]|nr:hypothetical protein EDB80DRAFT_309995 [Ilyonectria destructans]